MKKAAAQKTDLDKAVEGMKDVGSGLYWTPPVGRSTVRILPPWKSTGPFAGMFYFKAVLHYGFKRDASDERGMRAYPCVAEGQVACPACQFQRALQASSDADGKELIRRLRAITKFYVNVIVRTVDADEAQVQIWGMGTTIIRQLRGYLEDPDYGDITDVEAGRDVIVEREGAALSTKYVLRLRPKATPLGLDDWESLVHQLDDVVAALISPAQFWVKLAEEFGDAFINAVPKPKGVIEKAVKPGKKAKPQPEA